MDEDHFRELISGNKRSVSACLARAALSGLSWFYQCGAGLQRMAYDVGWKHPRQASVPVISVGNITTGGTGKTPFVAYLTHLIGERGVRVGLLSRGYRARSECGNDEKLVLDQLCPNVPHLQNKDRVSAAQVAVETYGCELLILDDGFQHRRLARDLDIVLIDAMNPWGFGNLLPRGLLREPIHSLSRADLVVITRVDQCSDAEVQAIRNQVARYVPPDRCLYAVYRPKRLINSRGETAPIDSLSDQKVLAFCGIGNPDSFRKSLADVGMLAAAFQTFPDHHDYSAKELSALPKQAQKHQASAIVTTQKDLVKIDKANLEAYPLWAMEIATEVLSGQESLELHLSRVLSLASEPTKAQKLAA